MIREMLRQRMDRAWLAAKAFLRISPPSMIPNRVYHVQGLPLWRGQQPLYNWVAHVTGVMIPDQTNYPYGTVEVHLTYPDGGQEHAVITCSPRLVMTMMDTVTQQRHMAQ